MSEVDRTAIEIVKNLQSNIRNTTIAMVGIFAVALLMAVFWGGGINNKVSNNEKNIDNLTKTVQDYIKEQQKESGEYVKREEIIPFSKAWSEMALNYGHISYWAESQGYKPLTRAQIESLQETKIN